MTEHAPDPAPDPTAAPTSDPAPDPAPTEVLDDPLPASEPPLLVADGLGLRGRDWVFRDVSLTLPAGAVAAVAGPAGSGRSMLLLALSGRAAPTAGRLTVAGHAERRRIRELVAVARITGAVQLEPDLRVRDHVREARLLTPGDHEWAADLVGLRADGYAHVADLPAVEATLLALALAAAARPRALVLDDLDAGVRAADRERLWRALHAVAGAGTAVITSVLDAEPARAAGAALVELPGREPNHSGEGAA
jgi:ABC-type multidrug transport system ATPase subunit